MKKLALLTLVIICTFPLTSFNTYKEESVKNKGIVFFKGTFEEALEKAKAENKFIFIDFYAKWCGQCKKLKKSFKDDEVGTYYNKNFINILVDGETKEGRELMLYYQIQSYPTLLIVDYNGRIQTKTTGYLKPYILINFGRRIVPY
ncbi:thioredoxin family protein [Flavobacterium sp. SM2513]|uniref:thioredoxin family protein n=1 Tax=Flavobacterium sp. SM2513 TaxID=3424766 RepID=UPI003D7F5C86